MPTPILQKPLPANPATITIGNVPTTGTTPTWKPANDQIPLAVNPVTGEMWAYASEWVKLHKFELKALEEVSLKNITNLENVLRVPVAYEAGNEVVEGYVTLKELKQILNKVNE